MLQGKTRWKIEVAKTGFFIGFLEFGGLGLLLGAFAGSGILWFGLLFGGFAGAFFFGMLGYTIASSLLKQSVKQQALLGCTYLAYWLILSIAGAFVAYFTFDEIVKYASNSGLEKNFTNLFTAESISVFGYFLGLVCTGLIIKKIKQSNPLLIDLTEKSSSQEYEMNESSHGNMYRRQALPALSQPFNAGDIHAGGSCPSCGYGEYCRDGPELFLCVNCQAKLNIVSSKAAEFYLCAGREMNSDQAKNQFILSNENLDEFFPLKTIMINKNPKK